MHLEQRILVTGGAGFLGSHLCERLLVRGRQRHLRRQFLHRRAQQYRAPARPQALRADPPRRHLPALCRGRPDLQSGLPGLADPLPARPGADHQDQRARRHQHAGARQARAAPRSCRPRRRRSMAIPTSIRRPRTTGATSIRSARAPATTKASAAPRRCSSTTAASTSCRSRSRASSTPTARACTRTTGAWCRISSCRRCSARDITVYGDGSQTRSFCYVDDLIEGLVRLMATPDQVTGPINIGNPTEFTILELATQVIDLTGSRSRIVHRPMPEDDPRQRRPDISKAQDMLQWAPRTPLREGLDAHDRLFRGAAARCRGSRVALDADRGVRRGGDGRRRSQSNWSAAL